ncbi:hypothetical protein SH412_004999 [Planctellipticum variicoloris]|nr:hypothetical protein SH412_004999 [Planctomycetaceae bacterium SH412]
MDDILVCVRLSITHEEREVAEVHPEFGSSGREVDSANLRKSVNRTKKLATSEFVTNSAKRRLVNDLQPAFLHACGYCEFALPDGDAATETVVSTSRSVCQRQGRECQAKVNDVEECCFNVSETQLGKSVRKLAIPADLSLSADDVRHDTGCEL